MFCYEADWEKKMSEKKVRVDEKMLNLDKRNSLPVRLAHWENGTDSQEFALDENWTLNLKFHSKTM